jgi:post-segregation antitoxin (ccd killing protein)
MSTTRISVSMPIELHERMKKFDCNWSVMSRERFEQEVRIREAIADGDRIAALREKAKADCADVEKTGLEDALSYPIEEIDYADLRIIGDRTQASIEDADPVATIAVFDEINGTFTSAKPKFRLRFRDSWEYKFGFMAGLAKLKSIADGKDETPRPTKKTSIFDNPVNTLKED